MHKQNFASQFMTLLGSSLWQKSDPCLHWGFQHSQITKIETQEFLQLTSRSSLDNFFTGPEVLSKYLLPFFFSFDHYLPPIEVCWPYGNLTEYSWIELFEVQALILY